MPTYHTRQTPTTDKSLGLSAAELSVVIAALDDWLAKPEYQKDTPFFKRHAACATELVETLATELGTR